MVALQGGSALNRALWTRMIDISASMFNEVYGRLGIDSRLALCGESFYNDKIPGMLEELATAADILGAPLLEADEGATVLRVPGFEVPLMVRKSDGGYGYDTTGEWRDRRQGGVRDEGVAAVVTQLTGRCNKFPLPAFSRRPGGAALPPAHAQGGLAGVRHRCVAACALEWGKVL